MDDIDRDFDALDRKLAERDLQELKQKRRRLAIQAAAIVGLGAVVILGFRLVLKDSPCIDLLQAAESKRLDGDWEQTDDLQPGTCHVTLSGRDRAAKLRISAFVARSEDGARGAGTILRLQPFEAFEPLGIGDDGLLAVAKPRSAGTLGKLEEGPPWSAMRGGEPFMHVAVFQKDDVVVTVELDPHSFDAAEATELVESMKPGIGELRRLAPR